MITTHDVKNFKYLIITTLISQMAETKLRSCMLRNGKENKIQHLLAKRRKLNLAHAC